MVTFFCDFFLKIKILGFLISIFSKLAHWISLKLAHIVMHILVMIQNSVRGHAVDNDGPTRALRARGASPQVVKSPIQAN